MGRGLKSCAASEVDTTTGIFRIVRRRDPNSGYLWRRHCRERKRERERGREREKERERKRRRERKRGREGGREGERKREETEQ